MHRIDITTTDATTWIRETIEVLDAGGLIIFPTETTYGVGVDATNPRAVQKLLAYKSRREGKPLSIAVASREQAERYVEINEQAAQAYQQFLPGPVTVVSLDRGVVAPGVASEFGTLGIRIPDYPALLELLRAYDKPITATSANASGGKRPYQIDALLSDLTPKQREKIDLILDAGTLPPNPPSLVVDTTLSAPVILRDRDSLGQADDERSQTQTLISDSPEMTKRIAGTYLLKHWNTVKEAGLVIGLDGALGAGKTVFAQGVAQFLTISEQLTSPTYTYIEEYNFERHGFRGKLFHCDFWKVGSRDELNALDVQSMLQPGTIVIIEWWEQVATWMDVLPGAFLHVQIEDDAERAESDTQERKIIVTESAGQA